MDSPNGSKDELTHKVYMNLLILLTVLSVVSIVVNLIFRISVRNKYQVADPGFHFTDHLFLSEKRTVDNVLEDLFHHLPDLFLSSLQLV